MRQAHLCVEYRRGGLRVRPDLAGGRAQSVRSLQRVTPLHAAAAVGTMADVDAELPHDRLTRDLGLELLCHGRLDEVAAAMRAGIGQGNFVAFADLFGGRRRAVAMPAVLGTGLA